jgi:hypothetical protein
MSAEAEAMARTGEREKSCPRTEDALRTGDPETDDVKLDDMV